MQRGRNALVAIGGVAALCATASLIAPAAAAGATKPSVTVIAAHTKLEANGTSTSRITVKVHVGSTLMRNARVKLTLSGAPAASCGKLVAVTGATNRNGIFSTTYRASTTVGFCTTAAAVGSIQGTAVIDQTSTTVTTPFSVTLAARSTKIQRDQKEALSISVQSGAAPVVSDPIKITETPLQAGGCGSIGPSQMSTSTAGQLIVTYYGSAQAGSCQLKASEAMSGASSNAIVIQQSGLPVV